MRTILLGECRPENTFELVDPDRWSEMELEYLAAKALTCAFPDYRCFVFAGTFEHEGLTHRPDLALVARDFSHWFIVEVELTSHSLEGHVLPQVRTFRNGRHLPDCETIMSRELSVSTEQAKTLLMHVPRYVVVVANKFNLDWKMIFKGIPVQLLTVSQFRSPNGVEILEVNGSLEAPDKVIGWGTYSAIDRAIRSWVEIPLASGEIMMLDPGGTPTEWLVTRDQEYAWISKKVGVIEFADKESVKVVKLRNGRFALRRRSDVGR